MNNYIQPGHSMDYENTAAGAAAIKSGGVVEFAGRIGVASADIGAGEVGAVAMVGVFALPKGNANVTQGQAVFWKNGAIVTAATDAAPAGYAFYAAPTADAFVSVKIG